MTILVKNISDFSTMITTCIANGIKDIRIFISSKQNTAANTARFTFILFTPLYTAIYRRSVTISEYEKIYNELTNCQEQCNHDFRIQVFEKISYNPETNTLDIGKELEII